MSGVDRYNREEARKRAVERTARACAITPAMVEVAIGLFDKFQDEELYGTFVVPRGDWERLSRLPAKPR